MTFSFFSFNVVLSLGGFLKNDASPSGLAHWFRNLGSPKNIIKKPLFLGTNGHLIYMSRLTN